MHPAVNAQAPGQDQYTFGDSWRVVVNSHRLYAEVFRSNIGVHSPCRSARRCFSGPQVGDGMCLLPSTPRRLSSEGIVTGIGHCSIRPA